MIFRWLLPLLAVAFLARPTQATVLLVDAQGSGEYLRIQDAIVAAVTGDEILVLPGTYTENLDFLGKNLWVHSSAGPDLTTIDGGGGPPGASSCIYLHSGESFPAVLQGFTLTNGQGTTYQPSGYIVGGAVLCYQASLTLRNCRLHNNASVNGGAVFFGYGNVDALSCEFRENVSQTYGGAVSGDRGSFSASDCLFELNQAVGGDGAISVGQESQVTLTGCVVRGNRARAGAGLNLGQGSARAVVSDCRFEKNVAEQLHGGGLRVHGGSANLEGCLFADNDAAEDGGAVVGLDLAVIVMRNCTLDRNLAGRFGAQVALWDGSRMDAGNCILSGGRNGGGAFVSATETPVFTCSDAWNNVGGNYLGFPDPTGTYGNIAEDPLFCDPEHGIYTVAQDSPCAPHTPPNPTCDLIGAYPAECGPTGASQIASRDASLRPLIRIERNPFVAPVSLGYSLPKTWVGSERSLRVYDASGRSVRRLVLGRSVTGTGVVIFDGRDDGGRPLPAGSYSFVLGHGAGRTVENCVLLR